MTPEIKQYLKLILEEAGQTNLPEAVEEQLLKDLNTRLEDRLILKAMAALSEEKQIQLQNLANKEMTEKEQQAILEKFLQENIPNYTKHFQDTLSEFKALYIKGSKR